MTSRVGSCPGWAACADRIPPDARLHVMPVEAHATLIVGRESVWVLAHCDTPVRVAETAPSRRKQQRDTPGSLATHADHPAAERGRVRDALLGRLARLDGSHW
jgi:hypothetical protein